MRRLFFFFATFLHPRKELLCESYLLLSAADTHHPVPKVVGIREIFAVPGQVFAGHPNAGRFPIKPVQFVQVAEHDSTQIIVAKLRSFRSRVDERAQFAEDPWPALCAASDHQTVSVS